MPQDWSWSGHYGRRPYVWCLRGCGWLYEDRIQGHGGCKKCATPWLASWRTATGCWSEEDKPQGWKGKAPSLPRSSPSRSLSSSRRRGGKAGGRGRDLAAGNFSTHVSEGFGGDRRWPEKSEGELVDTGNQLPNPILAEAIRSEWDRLPDSIKEALPEGWALPPTPPAPPTAPSRLDAPKAAAEQYKDASAKLRDLGYRKVRQEARVAETKMVYESALEKLHELQAEFETAQAEAAATGQDFATMVLSMQLGSAGTEESQDRAFMDGLQGVLSQAGVALTEAQADALASLPRGQRGQKRPAEPVPTAEGGDHKKRTEGIPDAQMSEIPEPQSAAAEKHDG